MSEFKLQDVIHYYVGCKIYIDAEALDYPTIDGVDKENVIISSYRYKTPNCDKIFERPRLWKSIDSIKPILRKLGDMTEQEMIGLLQSMVPSDMEDKPKNDDYDLEMFYNDDGLMVDGDIAVGANFTCICFDGQIGVKKCGSIILFEEDKDVTRDQLINTPMAFNYLLKQSFDLFNLIENGLAIDSNTLK